MGRLALVVDDSMLIRHTVCRFLEERDFEVHAATNGLEAWNLLQERRPDLIVTDLAMPKMSGMELISQVKSVSELEKVPIVVLTSRRMCNETNLEEQRPDCVLYKDIDIEEQLSSALATIFAAAR